MKDVVEPFYEMLKTTNKAGVRQDLGKDRHFTLVLLHPHVVRQIDCIQAS